MVVALTPREPQVAPPDKQIPAIIRATAIKVRINKPIVKRFYAVTKKAIIVTIIAMTDGTITEIVATDFN